MSNSTSISDNPADRCPRITGWRVPRAWSDSASSNFTQAACAVPACNDFPSTLADCCGRSSNDLEYFNTTIGPYASCALADSTNPDTYRAFQSCLADKEVAFFKCNSQERENTNDECGRGILPAPINNTDWPNMQICSLSASVNATRAMKNCCSNYDSDFLVFKDGCQVGCVSNSTNGTFSDCITDTFKDYQGVICTTNDGRENPNNSAGTRALPSLSGLFTILMLSSLMLML
ncbi:hypothetical protein M436DRAFT_53580 [Aureobasidium namibiae CBS 147.97]|uniref:Uncharacterized protein n=1 Tax=Aureobasidium namibiae CBS 147.97 TaxID=1043004 RepID=A0A074WFV8_9PEZI|nr:uncharacterized protein M436DRAFT_53580 [Aureobasidium namibiae CBS 147.97]KEQ70459.1 hypothetical protein M436DRAFT_53580 [Aureobasidium namibiae CBS 147.97]